MMNLLLFPDDELIGISLIKLVYLQVQPQQQPAGVQVQPDAQGQPADQV